MKKIGLIPILLVLLACEGRTPASFTALPKTGPQQSTLSGGGSAEKIDLGVGSDLTGSSTVLFGESVSIIATVTTAQGINVDGAVIAFSVDRTELGTMSPSLKRATNGVASVTFRAGRTSGRAVITASVGSVSSQTPVTVDVKAPDTGSIEFVSASQSVIGLRRSGQTETSVVTFIVRDIQGNPVEDGIAVNFTMSGPGGGEFIGTTSTSTRASAATSNGGRASVTLSSGTAPGPVGIVATVVLGGRTLSTSAPAVSIGGGVPSAKSFTLATTRFNLPGLRYVNKEATISAFIADRVGNFNILKGTTISFMTEAGAMDRSDVTTSSDGTASVKIRTQSPDPVRVSGCPPPCEPGRPQPGIPGKPEDGLVTVLATVIGEEDFDDANGNGKFDTGEPFTDLPEPFIDKNNDTIRDNGTNGKPFEEFVDADRNGVYTEVNSHWDGPGCSTVPNNTPCEESKVIWTDITLAFTGGPFRCEMTSSTLNISNGEVASFTFKLGDINDNVLVPGTTISISSTKGELSKPTSFILLDGVGGPTDIGFSLSDSDSALKNPPDLGTVTVEVKGAEGVGDCARSMGVTIE